MSGKNLSAQKKEWMKKVEEEGRAKSNPTKDHDTGLKTLQNPIRRHITLLLKDGSLSLEEIQQEEGLSKMEAKFHIEMLENALYVDMIEKDGKSVYQLSPRGAGFLENVKIGRKKK